MHETVISHLGRALASILLAGALLAHATPAGATGLGLDKARALADTLAAYDAGAAGANVEIGGCKRRSANRVDCQNLTVAAATGAAKCTSMTAMSKHGARFFYARDHAAESCARTLALHPRGRKRVPGAVLKSLSGPPQVSVSCPAGLPGCPSASDLPRCPAAPAPCPPVTVNVCSVATADCPALDFGRCPADRDACPHPPSGQACLTDQGQCGTPLVDCTIQPIDCGNPPTTCNLVTCAPLVPAIGCATGSTLCPPVVTGSGTTGASAERLCWYVPHKRWVRRPPPARKRVHEARHCATI